ncbi:MAG: 3,4-dihydroxy-2-butanone-4-phosphate synthase [Gammaproteobacteria bacterium]|nr:3,4-dihydroxy-2-butanone-4-phosphate synthase [Gammaproteobacteria bacterium]
MNDTKELIAELREGRMVVLMDDQDRENEGDLVMAASLARAEHVNFMAQHGRGLICLTLTRADCERLHLPLMSERGFAHHGTNFTVSIDAARGIATGISAADRARTIRAAADPASRPGDLVRPGHVFPLMAHPGGVRVRAGHTEAGCDLTRLADLPPAAVIVEILGADGSMARRPELEAFARRHGLKIGTIADLIRFRLQHEKTVRRIVETPLATRFGECRLALYEDDVRQDVHLALVFGEIREERPTLVRVHLQHPVHDLAAQAGGAPGGSLSAATLEYLAREGGVAVLLCNQIGRSELLAQVERLRDSGGGRPGAWHLPGQRDLRTIGLGAQIIYDLGVRKMRVLSAPKRLHALAGFGLEVVEYVEGPQEPAAGWTVIEGRSGGRLQGEKPPKTPKKRSL